MKYLIYFLRQKGFFRFVLLGMKVMMFHMLPKKYLPDGGDVYEGMGGSIRRGQDSQIFMTSFVGNSAI